YGDLKIPARGRCGLKTTRSKPFRENFCTLAGRDLQIAIRFEVQMKPEYPSQPVIHTRYSLLTTHYSILNTQYSILFPATAGTHQQPSALSSQPLKSPLN